MDEALEKMTKLANELCDQLEKAEAENKSLKDQLAQVKTASAAPTAPVASAEAVQATCDALVKAGRLEQSQVEACKNAFMKDPDAAHRAIVQLLNAPAQEKKAAEAEDLDVSGGTLVGSARKVEDDSADKYASVYSILGLPV